MFGCSLDINVQGKGIEMKFHVLYQLLCFNPAYSLYWLYLPRWDVKVSGSPSSDGENKMSFLINFFPFLIKNT